MTLVELCEETRSSRSEVSTRTSCLANMAQSGGDLNKVRVISAYKFQKSTK